MTQRLKVYLVWDNSREEHGEGPTLIDVCATESVAWNLIDRESGGDADYRACFWVEPREVRE